MRLTGEHFLPEREREDCAFFREGGRFSSRREGSAFRGKEGFFLLLSRLGVPFVAAQQYARLHRCKGRTDSGAGGGREQTSAYVRSMFARVDLGRVARHSQYSS